MDNKDDYITELIESAHKSAESLEQTRGARDCLFCGGDDNLIFDGSLDDYVCEFCRLKLSETSPITTDLRTRTARISTEETTPTPTAALAPQEARGFLPSWIDVVRRLNKPYRASVSEIICILLKKSVAVATDQSVYIAYGIYSYLQRVKAAAKDVRQ